MALKSFRFARGAALAGLLLVLATLGATTVYTNASYEAVVWNGPKASPDTLAVPPSSSRDRQVIDYVYVANTTGGTATSANLAIWRFNRGVSDTTQDTLVVWQMKVPGGPAAAPALFQNVAPPGGLYRSEGPDTMKIIVTMASASSLYVACKYHEGR